MPARTGKEYIRGLSSLREVWINGERVPDVASHPILKRSIDTIANLYDLQYESEASEFLLYRPLDTDAYESTSFLIPFTSEDLLKRRLAIKTLADSTFGLMGRSPDFLNTAVMAFAAAKEFFSFPQRDFSQNIINFYKYCRAKDLFLAHAVINPQIDRSKNLSDQKDPSVFLHITEETTDGLIVSGAKMIATLAPIADELLVFPLPGLKPEDEAYAIAFSIPLSTPGLRLICREPFDSGGYSLFDHPLSSRFDEIDAACIFDNVLIPWERVFLYRDVNFANSLYDQTYARHYTGHQGIIRGLSKAELLVAIAIALAEGSKTNSFLHVQEMLGELLGYLELIEGAIILSESKAHRTQWGTLSPAIEPIQSLRYHFPRMYKRIVEIIQNLGGASLIMSPTERDFKSTLIGDIDRYYSGSESSAYDRVSLLKLAWEASGHSFGQRQVLYEQYHAGDPVRLAAMQYLNYDKTTLLNIIQRILH